HDPGRRLAQVPQVVVLPARHRLARRAHVRLAELEGEPLVMPPPGGPQRALLDGAFATHGVTPQVVVEARGWPLVLEFARMGMGLAIVNATCTIPAGLTARLLQGAPAVDYRVLGGVGRGAALVAALRAHRDAWRERRRSGFRLASRAP
ncbi:MAG: LysR family transcriptional regulator substrate-binding protein, partial [Myxococcales bacterium]|nr:LysR family transcriptional regulator substrate-binding protein [Myxococcales bacterium]